MFPKADISAADVSELPRAALADAAGMLARAFTNDPLVRYLFADRGVSYQYALHLFFSFILEQRLKRNSPPLGVMSGGTLAGLASISEPDASLAAPSAGAWPLPAFMGPRTTDRFQRYDRLVDAHRPARPHIYLGVLGVHPRAQGRGHGRALLDAVARRAEAHPLATGVYLETTSPRNVSLYQHAGYHVIGHDRLDEIEVWCMFRANG